MAIKKVAAKKKPGRPAKKATEKVVKKRAYNRKPKPEMAPVVEQVMQADQSQQNHDAIGHGEAQSNASVLREIEVIDLRGLDHRDRFGVLSMLDSEGYITSTMESLLETNNLLVGLKADTLVLNHQNKLVRPATWEEVSLSSDRISRPSLSLNVHIGFTMPEPAYEDVLTIGDARYVRVN